MSTVIWLNKFIYRDYDAKGIYLKLFVSLICLIAAVLKLLKNFKRLKL